MQKQIIRDLPLDVLPLDTTVDDLGLSYERPGAGVVALGWLTSDSGALTIRLVIALAGAWLFAAGDLVSFALLALALCIASVCVR